MLELISPATNRTLSAPVPTPWPGTAATNVGADAKFRLPASVQKLPLFQFAWLVFQVSVLAPVMGTQA